ncbi:MAG: hypothetical protein ABSA96_07355 [Candidatus Acidiferrales bacterium]|jgi:hypothetical protein
MRVRNFTKIVGLAAVCAFVSNSTPSLRAQNAAPAASKATQAFDPHDLDGVWAGDIRPDNGKYSNSTPEPPLTEWAKQHLLYKGVSHDILSGVLIDPKRVPEPGKDRRDNYYVKDQYGVLSNDPDGEYPGKNCEPLGAPAEYEYPNLANVELVTTRAGDRIFQMFEYHREWRTFWLDREHPKHIDPSFEGDSSAHWEGNTLVVDTIGFNGKSMISGVVGHSKSDAFHLVERFTRADHDHLQVDMTYMDPKAWGDKPWTGFHRRYHLVPNEDFIEFICSHGEYAVYDKQVTDPLKTNPPSK